MDVKHHVYLLTIWQRLLQSLCLAQRRSTAAGSSCDWLISRWRSDCRQVFHFSLSAPFAHRLLGCWQSSTKTMTTAWRGISSVCMPSFSLTWTWENWAITHPTSENRTLSLCVYTFWLCLAISLVHPVSLLEIFWECSNIFIVIAFDMLRDWLCLKDTPLPPSWIPPPPPLKEMGGGQKDCFMTRLIMYGVGSIGSLTPQTTCLVHCVLQQAGKTDTSHVQPATQATHAGSQHPENEKHVNTGWMSFLSVKWEMGGGGGGGGGLSK